MISSRLYELHAHRNIVTEVESVSTDIGDQSEYAESRQFFLELVDALFEASQVVYGLANTVDPSAGKYLLVDDEVLLCPLSILTLKVVAD